MFSRAALKAQPENACISPKTISELSEDALMRLGAIASPNQPRASPSTLALVRNSGPSSLWSSLNSGYIDRCITPLPISGTLCASSIASKSCWPAALPTCFQCGDQDKPSDPSNLHTNPYMRAPARCTLSFPASTKWTTSGDLSYYTGCGDLRMSWHWQP